MRAFLWLGLTFFAVFLLVAIFGGNSGSVDACTARGVAYFKEIGSYPRLSDGRSAEQVARERCGRSTAAFG